MREFQTDEKTPVAKFLAIDHLTLHGVFSFGRSNLHLLAELPGDGGVHANAVRTDIVGIGSLTQFAACSPYRRKGHFHHDRKSSFFSAGEAPVRAHSAVPFRELQFWFVRAGGN